MHTSYHFVSTFRVVGDANRVWDALADVGGWVRWWRPLESVDVLAGPPGASVDHLEIRPGEPGFWVMPDV